MESREVADGTVFTARVTFAAACIHSRLHLSLLRHRHPPRALRSLPPSSSAIVGHVDTSLYGRASDSLLLTYAVETERLYQF